MSTIGTLTEEYRKGEKTMSYTNITTHYELPQYVGTDIPSILTDLNDSYEAIDEAIYAVASRQSTDEAQVTALAQQVSTQGVEIAQNTTNLANEITARQNGDSALDTRLTTAENNISSAQSNISTVTTRVGALETKVGSGTLDTVAQDLVGAVNELHGEMPSGSAVEVQRATITAGQTSAVLTFTSQAIGANTLLYPFCSAIGVNATITAVTGTTVTVEIPAQSASVTVAVKAEN